MENKEIWKKVEGYDGRYWISNLGRVKSYANKAPIILKSTINKHGYEKLELSSNGITKSVLTHRLVACAFIPNPNNKPTVNHKNGIKNDNRLVNLEWATYEEQYRHSDNLGLRNIKGSGHYKSTLEEKDVLEIRNRLAKGETQLSISKIFNVSRSTIRNIKLGYTWSYLNSDHNFDIKTRSKKLSDSQIESIKSRLLNGENYKVLCNDYGVSKDTIYNIKRDI